MQIAHEVVEGKTDLTLDEVKQLIGQTSDHFSELPNVVETPKASIYYIGDLHGEYKSAKAIADMVIHKKKYHFVLLGDYGDRGPAQIETVNLVLALATKFPERVTVLRGNHESEEIAKRYGFWMDVSRKYTDSLFYDYVKVFSRMPLAGMSVNGIFSCHGGIPEEIETLKQLNDIDRFHPNFPDDIAFQLVWNDPVDLHIAFRANKRSSRAREFGRKAFDEFCNNLDVKLMFRAHEAYNEGYQTYFDGRLVSVFSTSYRDKVTPKIARVSREREYEIQAVPI
ncbi:MAG: hypothetical protein BAJATHORv1_60128 [Candidatus Thorarchaeota archaeon]|nr:MAG: hypothetical protein BAJATHORv1_60128 [Candidatus Thorarchaeota archaeon]